MEGAGAVHRSIIEKFPTTELAIGIVWIRMLDPDTPEATNHATRIVWDNRAAYFYDANQKIGKALAQQLGGSGEIAWDIYLFYDRKSEWLKIPPPPLEWMHQLEGRWWADPTHLYRGENLTEKLYTTMQRLETS